MPSVATKLFREPVEVEQAVNELKSKGFKAEEIVVIANEPRAKELGADIKSLPDVNKLTDMGVPEATVKYYDYSVSAGGIVVSVRADESRVAQAQEVLRTVPVCSCEDRMCGTSPGFQAAGRMSATNPIDAPMSGDFRRY